MAILGLGGLAGAEFTVQNPHPDEVSGTFAIPAEAIGTGAIRLVRLDSGAEIPSQVVEADGHRQIIGGLSLRGGQAVGIRAEAAAAAAAAAAPGLAIVADGQRRLRIENAAYRAVLDGGAGYRLTAIEDRIRALPIGIIGGLDLIDAGEPETYNGLEIKGGQVWEQAHATVAATILYAGPCEGAVRLAWSLGGSEVSQVLRVNAFNRLIRQEITLVPSAQMLQARYAISLPGLSSDQGEASMLPQDERNPQRMLPCPGYEFAWNPVQRKGVGLIASAGGNVLNATWDMRGIREGGTDDYNQLSLFSRPFRGIAPSGQPRMAFALMAGGDPQEIERYRSPAARAREFTAYPGTDHPLATIATTAPALVGVAQQVGVTIDPRCAGDQVSLRIGAATVFSGAIPKPRQFPWTPADEGPIAVTVLDAAGACLGEQVVMVQKELAIAALATAKIVFKPGEPRSATVTVRNQAGQTRRIVLRSSVSTGVDRRQVIDEQPLSLAAGEVRTVGLSWAADTQDGGGATLRTEALIGDRVVDAAEECFACSTSNLKVGQFSVANPGWFKAPGQEKLFAHQLRSNYFTAFEYYTWTPCPLMGLTPTTEAWVPQTESQAAYTCVIQRQFVLDFVKHFHANGLQILAWMSGEVSLPTGLDHPEHFRYSASGQPLFGNGQIWDGQRFAIANSATPYDEQEAYAWGRRFADSIDAFGWDGCRFDWNFTPHIVGDPMRAGETRWFTFAGKSSREVYTQPDRQAAAALTAFRRAVAERHPASIYGTNIPDLSERYWQQLPLHAQEASRHAWLWMETLLNYEHKAMSTWNLWAERMVTQFGRARRLGAQAGVGWMRMYPPGSVTHKLMPYAVLFSGLKWIGTMDRQESLGESWTCWRYAMRFAEFFYDAGFAAVPAARVGGEIALRQDAGAMWKPWVYERVDGVTREVLIGILNTDGGATIAERHPVPAPLRGLQLRIALAAGERIAGSALLAPEPTPHAIALPAPDADGAIALPTIDWAGAVLVRIARK